MTLQLEKRLFTIEDYYRMAETGILPRDDRVELIRGEIIRMSPVGDRHIAYVNKLTAGFAQSVGQDAIVSVQNPVKFPHLNSEPEPDLTLFRYKPDFYITAAPTPADILLVVEVADTSWLYDRNEKLSLYADAAVPEVWIMSVEDEFIDRFSALQDGEYRDIRRFRPGETISPTLFPNVRLDIAWLFGVSD